MSATVETMETVEMVETVETVMVTLAAVSTMAAFGDIWSGTRSIVGLDTLCLGGFGTVFGVLRLFLIWLDID